MRRREYEALRKRFQYRCGYCGVREQDVGSELTVDHFQPRSRGGLNTADNLVYACHPCNAFKGDYWQPDSSHRILHPLRDNLAEYVIEQENGFLLALNPTGAFHIAKLRLNRAALIAHRLQRAYVHALLEAQANMLESLDRLEEQLQDLSDQVEQLRQENRS